MKFVYLVKKVLLTIGGLSLGSVAAFLIAGIVGFISPKSGQNEVKYWGDVPIEEPLGNYILTNPMTRTKLEIAKLDPSPKNLGHKSKSSDLNGKGGAYYLGLNKISLNKTKVNFNIKNTKNSLLSLKEKKGIHVNAHDLRHQMESLVRGIPVGAPSLGRLTSRYGRRRSPFSRSSDFHTGIDIAAKYNSPVVASAEGVVVYAGRKGSYGRTILIKHEHGLETLYAHLSKINVKYGQKVRRGQKIGTIGNSGRSTGPHLHYEVRIEGDPQNPNNYIELAKILKSAQ